MILNTKQTGGFCFVGGLMVSHFYFEIRMCWGRRGRNGADSHNESTPVFHDNIGPLFICTESYAKILI